MPRYSTTVTHALSQSEAVDRLTAAVDRARAISDIVASWSGSVLTFTVTMQGIAVQGTADVRDRAIRVDCQLPLLAMAFRSWIPGIIGKALAPAPGGPAAPRPEGMRDTPVVLFMHIPKAAGTTFAEFIHAHCGDTSLGADELLRDGVLFLPYGFRKPEDLVVPSYARSLLARPDLRAVCGHFWFGLHEHVSRPSTYVTVIRDPVDRVVSLYNFLRIDGEMSLDAFAASPAYREVDNDQVRRLAGVEPRYGECTEQMLDAACAHLEQHFSVVGVTERLEETMAVARRTFDWGGDYTPPRRNVTTAEAPAVVVSEAQRDVIRRRNALDVRLHAWANAWLDRAAASSPAAGRPDQASTSSSSRDSTAPASK
ncbi:hypothetical protein TBR22_A06550 [Luteitalea sp. TBR-22]|uniref:polyhydroxyalkanoic acid system family protein n=1 Tax=Luteitalea sp. TBR-22 TaxID=2802971 RepID=UPI001AF7DC5D|nr:polyhydroxyalkanoic acid system family protein [Luteitalea sp. TBR-22]BCS31454.1 hypothetical protein TBR22_A06550 [Luteitalea sp. TBR-22]